MDNMNIKECRNCENLDTNSTGYYCMVLSPDKKYAVRIRKKGAGKEEHEIYRCRAFQKKPE